MLADQLQFFLSLWRKLQLRIVDQNGVFQIQTPGARVQVITGDQHPLIINPHPFQVIGVVVIFP